MTKEITYPCGCKLLYDIGGIQDIKLCDKHSRIKKGSD